MSLWWVGPPAEDCSLEEPVTAPTDADKVPRLIRSVVQQHFVSVACGGAHAMALTRDGRLFGWGWNAHGQCGVGSDLRPVPTPRAIGRLSGRKVAAVSCGAAHTVAIAREGFDAEGASCAVYAWGAHASGQCGLERLNPKKVWDHTAPGLMDELNGVAGPLTDALNQLGVATSDGLVLAQPLACGVAHSAMISAKGVLWTWGANEHGQCGQQRLGERVPPGPLHALSHESMRAVACGGAHSIALSRRGAVYAFGLNATGQLGDGSHHERPNPTPSPVRLPAALVVASIACGEEFSCCLGSNGELFSWGFGGCGEA